MGIRKFEFLAKTQSPFMILNFTIHIEQKMVKLSFERNFESKMKK